MRRVKSFLLGGPSIVGWAILILLFFFFLIPFVVTVAKSFQSFDTANPSNIGDFICLDNYRSLLHEPGFITSIKATLTYIFFAFIQIPVALIFAAWLRFLWPSKLPVLLIMILVLPILISPTMVGLMGRFFLNDQIGPLSRTLRFLGLLSYNDAPLGSSFGAWFCLSVIDAWQWIPFNSFLFWLCYRMIPKQQLEASEVDGLSLLSKIRFIAIPHTITPITIVIIFRLLEAFRSFDLAYILTGGGPGTSTLLSSIFANKITFIQQRLGVGAAHLVLFDLVAFVFIILIIGRLRVLRGLLR